MNFTNNSNASNIFTLRIVFASLDIKKHPNNSGEPYKTTSTVFKGKILMKNGVWIFFSFTSVKHW